MSYILVVDDEPDIRDLVKDILEDEGHEVATAENGLVARKQLRDRRLGEEDLTEIDGTADVEPDVSLPETILDRGAGRDAVVLVGHLAEDRSLLHLDDENDTTFGPGLRFEDDVRKPAQESTEHSSFMDR